LKSHVVYGFANMIKGTLQRRIQVLLEFLSPVVSSAHPMQREDIPSLDNRAGPPRLVHWRRTSTFLL
jgi:hypothetical protein